MRMDKAEEQISDIEDKILEKNEVERKREAKVMDDKGRQRELSDLLKHSNIHILEDPRR